MKHTLRMIAFELAWVVFLVGFSFLAGIRHERARTVELVQALNARLELAIERAPKLPQEFVRCFGTACDVPYRWHQRLTP